MQALPGEPSKVCGYLRKCKAKVGCFPLTHWPRREVSLEKGFLRWGVSSLDFAKTTCEVIEVEGSTSEFIVRPKQGHFWSDCDAHKYKQTAREFVFDVADSTISRRTWTRHLERHIAFGRIRWHAERGEAVAAALSTLEASQCAGGLYGTCPICLEDLCCDECSESSQVCQVRCGHAFHLTCAGRWLQTQSTCPLCREQVL